MTSHFKHILSLSAIAVLAATVPYAPAHAFFGGKDYESVVHAENGYSFGIVNFAKLMGESKAGKDLAQKIKKDLDALKAENSKKEDTLRKEKAALAALTGDEKQKETQTFAKKLAAAKNEAAKKRKKIDTRSGKAVEKLRKAIFDVLKDIQKANGYQAVFNQQSVVLMDNGVNITGQAMDALNQKMQTVSF